MKMQASEKKECTQNEKPLSNNKLLFYAIYMCWAVARKKRNAKKMCIKKEMWPCRKFLKRF